MNNIRQDKLRTPEAKVKQISKLGPQIYFVIPELQISHSLVNHYPLCTCFKVFGANIYHFIVKY